MKIFIDNWQAILYTSMVNILIAYLLFNSQFAKKRIAKIESDQKESQAGSVRYGTVIAFSSFLVPVMRRLVDEGTRLDDPDDMLLLIPLLIIVIEMFFPSNIQKDPRARRRYGFISISTLIAFTFVIFLP